ncbi:MAG: trigger factor [Proteobacteria bacterium]|nr:trigger factor [Pseudomonadota bacterium]
MEITETSSDGLKRELKVIVGASELEQRLSSRLDELKTTVNLKGFRPGKVPVSHLRKIYGRSVMAEILEQTISESTRKVISDRKERPALEPDISVGEDKDIMEKVIAGDADLAYTISFEVLPEIEITDLTKLKLEKPFAEVGEKEIDKGLQSIHEDAVTYASKDGKAKKGDQVTIDYAGKIGGKAFDGGTAKDAPVILGRGQFIPGFEKGLTGVKAGDKKTIKCKFPDDYPAKKLAGKEAKFDITVKQVAAPELAKLDDDFAKMLGHDTLAALRDTLETKLKTDYETGSHMKLKRSLLDSLNKIHKFELPGKLVEREFESVWQQVTTELESAGRSFEDEGTTEKKMRKDYQKLAERRVRLGLVLSEIGEKNAITITDDEVKQELMERARQFPGQEQEVYEHYQNNPEEVAELRVPIFENKVVNYILELATVTEKKVSAEDLFKDAEDDDGA